MGQKFGDGVILYDYMIKMIPRKRTEVTKKNENGQISECKEYEVMKLLSVLVEKHMTPHIVLPMCTFETEITHFTDLIKNGCVEKHDKDYTKFVNGYENGLYDDMVDIVISEWSNRGIFDDYVKRYHKKFQPIHWKVFFFQLISTLAVIQSKYPSFRHNNFNLKNVMIARIPNRVKNYKYIVCGSKYCVPNIGYQIKLWGFSDSVIYEDQSLKGQSLKGQSLKGQSLKNQYYDLYYFFNQLVKDYNNLPDDVNQFILSVLPLEFRDNKPDNFTFEKNNEYVTPCQVLESNPYFDEFRTLPKESRESDESEKESEKESDKSVIGPMPPKYEDHEDSKVI